MANKSFALLLVGVGLASALSLHTPQILDSNNEYVDSAAAVMKENHVQSAVLAIWEKDLVTGQKATSLWDSDFTTLLSYSCSNKTTSYEAGLDVTFDVNNQAAGKVAANDMVYDIGGDPAVTGGSSCSQMFNGNHASVHCYLPMALTLKKRDLPGLSGNSTAKCFTSPDAVDSLFGIIRDSNDGIVDLPSAGFFDSNGTDTGAVVAARARYIRVEGNGSPHKWKRHTILSSYWCGHEGCSVSYQNGKSITHTTGFSLTGVGRADWISASYSVSWSSAWSNTYSCPVPKGTTACIKIGKDYQEYRLRVVDVGTWTGITTTVKGPFNTWSPMKGREQIYCVVNRCGGGEGSYDWENFGSGAW